MLRIAIVEDDEKYADLLQEYLKKYGEERSEEFCCVMHKNAVVFLNNYKANYDIVFMDIDLPHMNGMTASQKLREVDKQVVLVFVTNLAQMAIKGYEVNAYDFIVKPVSYYGVQMQIYGRTLVFRGSFLYHALAPKKTAMHRGQRGFSDGTTSLQGGKKE